MVIFHRKIMDYDHPQDLSITPGPFAASLPTAMSGHGETTPKNDWGCRIFSETPGHKLGKSKHMYTGLTH